MRWFIIVSLFLSTGLVSAQARAARITKVLPHLLDLQGRNSLAPSLYERDAYQAYLRSHPKECSALRFDIRWAGVQLKRDSLKIRLELKVSGEPGNIVLEEPVKPNGFSGTWTSINLDGDAYKKAGKIIAWKATLWEDGKQVAELKSFLW